MPRAHTPEERERIEQRLFEAGREGFSRRGLAKVTIADLARGAGIGKGSFYRFFASKEALFLAIQEREEQAFKAALLREAEQAGSPREAVITLLRASATRLHEHPFLQLLLDPRTLAELTLRVPPEQLAAHRAGDREFFFSVVHDWKRRGWLREDLEPQTVFDVLAALFLVSAQRDLLSTPTIERATREMAEALAEHWCP